jgi:hypothetical protein
MSHTVWFALDAGQPFPVRITTEGSSFGTAIAAYTAPGDGAPFSEHTRVACSANGAPLTVDLVPSQRVYLQVGGRGGASGDMRVLIDCPGICPPGNDSAQTPSNLAPGHLYEINTLGATMEFGEQSPCGNLGRSVWFIMDRGLGDVSITTGNTDFPAVIAVYSLEGIFSPPGGARNIYCTTEGAVAVTTNDATSGYLVQVGGVDGAGGMLRLQASCTAHCPPGVVAQPMPSGGSSGTPGGAISGPDTGNGGHAARR